MKKEEVEEQFNREAAADEKASSEDHKHISGGVPVGVDSNLGAVESIPGNQGRMAQAWVNVRGGIRVFFVFIWHSEGWTPRNDALMEVVVKQARTPRHPWLIARDANMCPEDFEKSLWFQSRHMFLEEASAGRS